MAFTRNVLLALLSLSLSFGVTACGDDDDDTGTTADDDDATSDDDDDNATDDDDSATDDDDNDDDDDDNATGDDDDDDNATDDDDDDDDDDTAGDDDDDDDTTGDDDDDDDTTGDDDDDDDDDDTTGDDDDSTDIEPLPEWPAPEAEIGTAGGEVGIQGVMTLTIPAGALAANTNITVTPLTTPLVGSGALSARFKLEPAGTTFASPVTVRIAPSFTPFDADNVRLVHDKGGGDIEELTPALIDNFYEAEISSFSTVFLAETVPQVQPPASTCQALESEPGVPYFTLYEDTNFFDNAPPHCAFDGTSFVTVYQNNVDALARISYDGFSLDGTRGTTQNLTPGDFSTMTDPFVLPIDDEQRVIAYASNKQNGLEAWVRIINSDGTTVDSPVRVSDETNGAVYNPRIARTSYGYFATWLVRDETPSKSTGTLLRGAVLKPNLTVENTFTIAQGTPDEDAPVWFDGQPSYAYPVARGNTVGIVFSGSDFDISIGQYPGFIKYVAYDGRAGEPITDTTTLHNGMVGFTNGDLSAVLTDDGKVLVGYRSDVSGTSYALAISAADLRSAAPLGTRLYTGLLPGIPTIALDGDGIAVLHIAGNQNRVALTRLGSSLWPIEQTLDLGELKTVSRQLGLAASGGGEYLVGWSYLDKTNGGLSLHDGRAAVVVCTPAP